MLEFRPHHFLCSIGYEGKGYSQAFVNNYNKISQHINEDENSPIKVVTGLDAICSACPHSRPEENLCKEQLKINQLDSAHAAILKLSPGQILSFGQAKTKIRRFMSLKAFHKACAPCEWKSLGICEGALRKLKRMKEARLGMTKL